MRVGQHDDIFDVLGRHRAELEGVDGVAGVAVGRTPAGDDAIVVYILRPDVAPQLPSEIEGFAVTPVVTGPIDAL